MTGEITGTGAYVPQAIMENREIERLVETSDAWIQERTGIARRHIAVEETVAFMAAKAALQALKEAELDAEMVDLILVSTISAETVMPCTACAVQEQIGAVRAACFDLNAACCGFLMAYSTACAYLESGMFHNILIIGSERLSNLVDWSDRGTCILFGDGAGALVLTAAEGKRRTLALHSDGSQGKALTLCSRQDHSPLFSGTAVREERAYYMQMDGQAVFKFAVRKVPQVVEEVLEKNGMKKEDVRYYILHQANRRIVEAVARRLGEPASKFPMNMQEYGNTSSASIPILLHEMNRQGLLRPGDRLVIAGFGGGLTWGAAVAVWR